MPVVGDATRPGTSAVVGSQWLTVRAAGWSFFVVTALPGLADHLATAGIWSDPVNMLRAAPEAVDGERWRVEVVDRANRPGARWDPAGRRVEIAVPWPRGLAMVKATLRQVIDRVGQEHGVFRLHASAVDLGGRLVVLTGDSESGKTATAVDAWSRNGARIVANDWLTIRAAGADVHWQVGDTEINLRHGSLARVAPALAREVFKTGLSERRFDRAVRMPVSRLTGIEPGAPAGRTVDRLVLIRLDGGSRHLRLFQCGGRAAAVIEPARRLFELLSTRITGAAVLPVHDSGAMWPDFAVASLDDDALRRARAEFVDLLWRRGVLASVTGPLPLVRAWLAGEGQ